MGTFRPFEREVISALARERLGEDLLSAVLSSAAEASYEYTSSGYYLTIRHPDLPRSRIVCDKPTVIGESGDVLAGFVVFVEDAELTLECHSWGGLDIPEDFRQRPVEVKVLSPPDSQPAR